MITRDSSEGGGVKISGQKTQRLIGAIKEKVTTKINAEETTTAN